MKKKKGYRLYLPIKYEKPSKIDIPDVITKVINDSGYVIEDYIGNIAVKKDDPKRKIKIGKLLTKHEAARKAFENDPVRTSHRNEYIAVISAHPYDIVGMSTGRHWDNTSCMRLPLSKKDTGGVYHHKVKADVAEGTLVAYAIKPNDKNINSPSARVLIKPFLSVDDHRQVLFRVETRVYGENVPGFLTTINKWLKDVNKKVMSGVFVLPKSLYDDSFGLTFQDDATIYGRKAYKYVSDIKFSNLSDEDKEEHIINLTGGQLSPSSVIRTRFLDHLNDVTSHDRTEMLKTVAGLLNEDRLDWRKVASAFAEDIKNVDRIGTPKVVFLTKDVLDLMPNVDVEFMRRIFLDPNKNTRDIPYAAIDYLQESSKPDAANMKKEFYKKYLEYSPKALRAMNKLFDTTLQDSDFEAYGEGYAKNNILQLIYTRLDSSWFSHIKMLNYDMSLLQGKDETQPKTMNLKNQFNATRRTNALTMDTLFSNAINDMQHGHITYSEEWATSKDPIPKTLFYMVFLFLEVVDKLDKDLKIEIKDIDVWRKHLDGFKTNTTQGLFGFSVLNDAGFDILFTQEFVRRMGKLEDASLAKTFYKAIQGVTADVIAKRDRLFNTMVTMDPRFIYTSVIESSLEKETILSLANILHILDILPKTLNSVSGGDDYIKFIRSVVGIIKDTLILSSKDDDKYESVLRHPNIELLLEDSQSYEEASEFDKDKDIDEDDYEYVDAKDDELPVEYLDNSIDYTEEDDNLQSYQYEDPEYYEDYRKRGELTEDTKKAIDAREVEEEELKLYIEDVEIIQDLINSLEPT